MDVDVDVDEDVDVDRYGYHVHGVDGEVVVAARLVVERRARRQQDGAGAGVDEEGAVGGDRRVLRPQQLPQAGAQRSNLQRFAVVDEVAVLQCPFPSTTVPSQGLNSNLSSSSFSKSDLFQIRFPRQLCISSLSNAL